MFNHYNVRIEFRCYDPMPEQSVDLTKPTPEELLNAFAKALGEYMAYLDA
ncbi:hypothetical protein ACVW1B_003801 [Bradyrhizobium sp. USDA 4502]